MSKKAFTLAELSLIFFIMAVLAVLFYRTLKPDKIIYNNLYYAAYSQMEDAYREIRAYNAPSSTEDEAQKNVYTDGEFDIAKYCTFFNKIVNFIGDSGVNENYDAALEFPFVNTDEYYKLESDASDLFSDGKYTTLSNGMKIRFDRFKIKDATDIEGNQPEILVATIDINGDEEPNAYNKDIIQMEINANGVLPIGDIENNDNILKFRILSRYKEVGKLDIPISGDEKIVANALSYEQAACKANLPRHTLMELKDQSEKCGEITVIDPECKYNQLKCTIEVLKP